MSSFKLAGLAVVAVLALYAGAPGVASAQDGDGVGQFVAGMSKGSSWTFFNPTGNDQLVLMFIFRTDGSYDEDAFSDGDAGTFDGCNGVIVNDHGRSESGSGGDFYGVDDDGEDSQRSTFHSLILPVDVASPDNWDTTESMGYGMYALGRHAQPASAVPVAAWKLPPVRADRRHLVACACRQLDDLGLDSDFLEGAGIRCIN